MSDSFDPYHIWLGIPPTDQPPNHYRLLGLQALEENTDVIDAAANRQTTYLHEMAAGPNRKESQQLLNEVAAARRCLLNPEKKNEYDENLRADARAAPPPAAVPIAQAIAPPPAPIAVPPVAPAVARAVVPPEPAIDTGSSPVTEFPNFNFGDTSAETAPVINADIGFPNLDAPPSNPIDTTVQQPPASDPNLPDRSASAPEKKGVPKQWIIAGCSIAAVAIAAAVFSNGAESKTKSTPNRTTTKLDGSGAAVTTDVGESTVDATESPMASNEEAPKKSKPSLFDQVDDQDSFFKVPTSFPGKEKKKEK